ncbi:NAD(P)-binding protein [Annulohypoxylon stygium]|nr:NAD(P)-binding protein [Annulohypoxylon stygium]
MATTIPLIWLITGATSGFGLELAKVAAERGDLVIGTSRNPPPLSSFTPPLPANLTLARLDHNESLDSVKKDIDIIFKIYGTVDIVVNNAAYVQTGTIEELTPEETLKQFQANIFGPINVYRAVLPHLRAKNLNPSDNNDDDNNEEMKRRKQRYGKGALITIGSIAAWFRMDATYAYNAAKAALRAMTLGLAEEVRQFDIRHALFEPGFFRTEFLKLDANFGSTPHGNRIPAYGELNARMDAAFRAFHKNQLGDTRRGCEVIYEIVTGTGVAEGRALPEEVPLGGDAVVCIRGSAGRVLRAVDEWEVVARLSDIPGAPTGWV